MNNETIQRIKTEIQETVGIELSIVQQTLNGKYSNFDQQIIFRPEMLPPPWGYEFHIQLYPKHFEVHFVPDSYSLQLLKDMEHNKSGHKIFSEIATSLGKNSELTLKINDVTVSPTRSETWPLDWRRLDISLEKYSSDFDLRDFSTISMALKEYASRFFIMVISLMPLEENPQISNNEGLPEGAKVRVEINKYERNPINRAACIAVYGTSCKVCGFNFNEMYGPLGDNFIHVHHIVPVSKMVENYVVNPVLDLTPVCPNCHAMLHREDPPIDVKKLKEIIAETLDTKKSRCVTSEARGENTKC